MTRTIAIVGGGLSGSLTAVHLMRRAVRDDLRILLFDRGDRIARGLAYGTPSRSHVLNVPAARMSAFADDPEHFLRFAQAQDPAVHGGSFVPRGMYGDYLEWLLQDAQRAMGEPGRFGHVATKVGDVRVDPVRGWVVNEAGAAWPSDRIVLALGNYAPADPPLARGQRLDACGHYLRDPWAAGALDRIDPALPVLLLGTGLTMVDIVLSLHARGCRSMRAVSRRGLLPHPHREHGAPPLGLALPEELEAGPASLPGWLALIRERCREQAALGIDWRETLASLRQITPRLWQRLDLRARRQFLRHLQPYWDVHRHRLAPQPARALAELLGSGDLRVHAGRLLGFDGEGTARTLAILPRNARTELRLPAAQIVNCTGPATKLATVQAPLLAALQARGLLQPDPLGLGIEVDERLAMRDASGRPSPVLHYIGPFLRARDWECTAVPELRVQAALLASRLAEGLPVPLAA